MIDADGVCDINLDGEWQFAFLPEWNCESDALPESARFCATMPVPAYWDDQLERLSSTELWREVRFNPSAPRPMRMPLNESPPDATLPFLLGTGFYRRTIHVPAEWRDRSVTLRVGGAIMEACVFINRRRIAHHIGHSTPFDICISKELLPGAANDILIAVSNMRTDRRGASIRGYAGRTGGIYRSVSLHVAAPVNIRSLFLSPDPDAAKIHWSLELCGDPSSSMEACWTIHTREDGVEVASGHFTGAGERLEWMTVSAPLRPWSDREPVLYDVEVRLRRDGAVCDVIRQPFGFRRIQRDGTSLLLNGVPVYLRGTTEHHYFPLTCTAPRSAAEYRHNIRQLKELGFNWIRFHTWIPSHEYMQAADELGMLIQVEPSGGFSASEWIEILHACRIHPSVVLYCCGNEQTLDEARIEFVRRMSRLQKEHAPDALFSPMEALPGIEYGDVGPDGIMEPFPNNPRRLETVKEFSDVLENAAYGMASYSSVRGDWKLIEERHSRLERPVLSHEICIHGNYLNLDLEHRYAGTRIGTDLYAATRAHLQANGLLHKAALYYRNSCAQMRLERKHAVETVRKCSRIAGYDLLGATDQHWHRSGYPCGIMNEFYELKPGESATDVRRYNGESVLLLDCSNRRNLRPGQKLAFDVLVSLFSPQPADDCVLSWSLKLRNDVLLSGSRTVHAIPNGCVTSLGALELVVPAIASASRVVLQLRLSGGHIDLENAWDFWIFPETRELSPAARVIDSLDAAALDALAGGTDTVLFGSRPFPTREMWFQSSSAGRGGGCKGSVIADHPLMQLFPHDGCCEWQFFPLMDRGAQAVLFERADLPFNPIIELISPFKRIRKQAVLFEYRVGKGRLLVCSLNLRQADPAAAWMRHAISRYVVGPWFNPDSELAPTVLAQLIKEQSGAEAPFETDQGHDPNA